MEFFRLLWDESRRDCVRIIIVDLFAGIANAALVAVIIISARSAASAGAAQGTIRRSLAHLYSPDKDRPAFYLVLFAIALSAFLFGRRFVMIRTGALAERIVAKIRLRIIDKIRRSNLLLYERVGKSHIYSALNESTFTLSSSATYIAMGLSAAFMLLFSIGYIAFLSLPAFLLTVGALAGGVWIYSQNRKTVSEETAKSTQKEREFIGTLDHLLDGFKEVKMHEPRNEDLYQKHLARTIGEAEQGKNRTTRYFVRISLFGQTFFFALLAIVIFILPSYSPSEAGNVMAISAIILFIMGPLGDVIGAFPFLLRSNAAIANIRQLEVALDAAAGRASLVEGPVAHQFRSFQYIECTDVTFAYDEVLGRDSFRLGPFDLTIHSKEILFLVGGNGSGKSTLLKILTGLYPCRSGTISVDGQPITPSNLPAYRSLFSTVFTDFHLFDRLYGLGEQDPAKINALLSQMELSDFVSIVEGRFTTTSLSTGQKKRLALIVALLEGRPILVFDEVGADQDPHFRKYYYEVILRQLQDEGRTIIAASHDEPFFHCADRILRMEFGAFEDITNRYHQLVT
jgi:putative ATP-binding cassette transporter